MAAPAHLQTVSLPDEDKGKNVCREYLQQDESPSTLSARRAEAALVRRLDTFIAPVMMMLMLISYLDRGNIGFAATQGMADDIGLKGTQLNVSSSLSLQTFSLVKYLAWLINKGPDCRVGLLHLLHPRRIPDFGRREAAAVPSCYPGHHLLLGRRVHVHRLRAELRGARYDAHLLGLLRGMLVPFDDVVSVQLVSRRQSHHPRDFSPADVLLSQVHERGTRNPCCLSLHRLGAEWRLRWPHRVGGAVHGWDKRMARMALVCISPRSTFEAEFRRLYVIEGLITIAWAFACIFLVPKNYESAYFLDEQDKKLMRERAERAEAYSGGSGHVTKADIKEAARDVKSWLHGCIQIAVVTILYGFGTFLPIIIRYGFRYSTQQASRRFAENA